MACKICQLCEKEFKTGIVNFDGGKIRIGTHRKFCLSCVPPGSSNPNQFTGRPSPQRLCFKCGKHFNVQRNGKYLNSRKKYCFECVPFATNHMKAISDEGKTKECYRCKRQYTYQRRGTHQSRKNCNSCGKWRYERKIKAKAVEYKGGKCNNCGFDKFYEALCFHHLDPTKKKFAISKVTTSISWNTVKKEINKCVLLCLTCHAGVHAGHIEV